MNTAEIKEYLKKVKSETYTVLLMTAEDRYNFSKSVCNIHQLIGACETLLEQVEILESLNKDLEYRIMGLEK